MTDHHRFPAPWRIVEMPGCFVVQDATGRNVAWFHFQDNATVAPRLKQGAMRRAINFAGPLLDKAGSSHTTVARHT
jgi:hypothetical protein